MSRNSKSVTREEGTGSGVRCSTSACRGVVSEDEDARNAREILKFRASYVNIKINPRSERLTHRHIQVFPTTFFVDRTGSVVGSVIFGMRSKAQFLAEADSRLEMLGE